MSKKIKHFLNLTNGIEALKQHDLDINDVCFIRLQSCYVEEHIYEDILRDFDHNFLMFAALGYECRFYDYGAKAVTSKAAYMGMAWVEYFINRRWFDIEIESIVKGKNITSYMRKIYSSIGKRTKKRYDYYKKYLLTDKFDLLVITDATTNDNKPDYYRSVLEEKYK